MVVKCTVMQQHHQQFAMVTSFGHHQNMHHLEIKKKKHSRLIVK